MFIEKCDRCETEYIRRDAVTTVGLKRTGRMCQRKGIRGQCRYSSYLHNYGQKPTCEKLHFLKSGKIGFIFCGSYWQFRLKEFLIMFLMSKKQIQLLIIRKINKRISLGCCACRAKIEKKPRVNRQGQGFYCECFGTFLVDWQSPYVEFTNKYNAAKFVSSNVKKNPGFLPYVQSAHTH